MPPASPSCWPRGGAAPTWRPASPWRPAADRILAANAYFGAMPVAEALERDPHIVICGRVTDTGITLGPAHARVRLGPRRLGPPGQRHRRRPHHRVRRPGHGRQLHRLAEGARPSSTWASPSWSAAQDGSLHRHQAPRHRAASSPARRCASSCSTRWATPGAYLTPDVVADFSTIAAGSQDGPDRVRVSGVQGRPPTDLLKVSIAYADGFKSQGALIVSGPDARAKAEVFAAAFWERCAAELDRRPWSTPAPSTWGTTPPTGASPRRHRATEILLRLSARSARREGLEVFRKLLPSMILSGPCGVAVTGGAPAISDVVSYWPALRAPGPGACPRRGCWRSGTAAWRRPGPRAPCPGPRPAPGTDRPWRPGPLDRWPPETGPRCASPSCASPTPAAATRATPPTSASSARSGPCYAWLRDHVTAEPGQGLVPRPTAGAGWSATRCPDLWALNFLLEETLGGGGTMSLHLDAQGKTLAAALLRCEVEVPRGPPGHHRPREPALPRGTRAREARHDRPATSPWRGCSSEGETLRVEALAQGVMRLVLEPPPGGATPSMPP